MSAASRRAANREREAAAILGSKRVRRTSRFDSAPDVQLVTLPCGVVLSPEVKTRAKLPVYLSNALEQARGYAPEGAEPIAIISETGGRALAVIDARAFARIAGINQPRSTSAPPIPEPPPNLDSLTRTRALAAAPPRAPVLRAHPHPRAKNRRARSKPACQRRDARHENA